MICSWALLKTRSLLSVSKGGVLWLMWALTWQVVFQHFGIYSTPTRRKIICAGAFHTNLKQ